MSEPDQKRIKRIMDEIRASRPLQSQPLTKEKKVVPTHPAILTVFGDHNLVLECFLPALWAVHEGEGLCALGYFKSVYALMRCTPRLLFLLNSHVSALRLARQCRPVYCRRWFNLSPLFYSARQGDIRAMRFFAEKGIVARVPRQCQQSLYLADLGSAILFGSFVHTLQAGHSTNVVMTPLRIFAWAYREYFAEIDSNKAVAHQFTENVLSAAGGLVNMESPVQDGLLDQIKVWAVDLNKEVHPDDAVWKGCLLAGNMSVMRSLKKFMHDDFVAQFGPDPTFEDAGMAVMSGNTEMIDVLLECWPRDQDGRFFNTANYTVFLRYAACAGEMNSIKKLESMGLRWNEVPEISRDNVMLHCDGTAGGWLCPLDRPAERAARSLAIAECFQYIRSRRRPPPEVYVAGPRLEEL